MGQIVFATPSIERFHLHEVLARRLMRRGHDVTVWAADPVTGRFYRTQGLRTRILAQRPATAELRGVPLEDLAARACSLEGSPAAGPARLSTARLARARRSVTSYAPALLRQFSTHPPDLVFFHNGRSALHRLTHFFATEFGSETLHTGDGLIPGTMQWDSQGIDGDSSKGRRTAEDYSRHPRDEMVLMAALAAVLGGTATSSPPLNRVAVRRPAFFDRVAGVLDALRRKQFGPAWHGLNAWRRAIDNGTQARQTRGELPVGPFVAVLLQDLDSAAIRLDTAGVESGSHDELVVAVRRATVAVDSALPIVVIPPDRGLSAADVARLRSRLHVASEHDLVVCSEDDRMTALTTALAVVTINHPHGLVAILAGTPLLHTGQALYGHAGVASSTTLDGLRDDLQRAIQSANPPHRSSYLTRALVYDHVWCSPTEPDSNGLRGLVQTIETQIERQASGAPSRLDYHPGPTWTSGLEV